MADFTQTVENRLGIYSSEPSNKWGTLEWGNNNWGYSQDVIVDIGKVVADSTTNTTNLNFDVEKEITSTTTITDTVTKEFILTPIENSVTFTNVLDNITLVDSAGFYHVFTGNTTEGEDQVITQYTEASEASGTWISVNTTSTTWS